ncbi:MAG: ribosomal protein L7/L12 [Cyanobacteriota bacterium]|nr:ribosomal protein L7/L12 [Cyanobacteriota bacterium]MDY6364333.1 ribosomal protein L7/L12 [Cyanobacteriota bacterium]MDY6383599.1 ribosomal protein L7/L12 [Cyanobacteriota bacterium]
MIDERFLYAAIALMLIFIARDLLKKYCNFDMDKFDVVKFCKNFKRMCNVYYKKYFDKKNFIISKHTGNKSLELVSLGENPATVMATLRQITGITYDHAKWIVAAVPTVFMTNISDAEADLNKKALEFVGAKVEIK